MTGVATLAWRRDRPVLTRERAIPPSDSLDPVLGIGVVRIEFGDTSYQISKLQIYDNTTVTLWDMVVSYDLALNTDSATSKACSATLQSMAT